MESIGRAEWCVRTDRVTGPETPRANRGAEPGSVGSRWRDRYRRWRSPSSTRGGSRSGQTRGGARSGGAGGPPRSGAGRSAVSTAARGPGSVARPAPLVVVLGIGLLLFAGIAMTGSPSRQRVGGGAAPAATVLPPGAVRITASPSSGPTARLSVGVTHTQVTADQWRDQSATARARSILLLTSRYQNQSIMGWGALNPEPTPGVYDWSSLDRRMALIRRASGTPVITLCCAPDWMKGGRPGRDRLVAARGSPHLRSLRRLRPARGRGRAAVPGRAVLPGVERDEGLLRSEPEAVGRRGLHAALQRGVRRGEGGPADRAHRRAVRGDPELDPRTSRSTRLRSPGRGGSSTSAIST